MSEVAQLPRPAIATRTVWLDSTKLLVFICEIQGFNFLYCTTVQRTGRPRDAYSPHRSVDFCSWRVRRTTSRQKTLEQRWPTPGIAESHGAEHLPFTVASEHSGRPVTYWCC